MNFRRWRTESSSIKFENDYWSYYIDQFSIENGISGDYHYVHTEGSTIIIPVLPEKNFLLIHQYRYLNRKSGIEFPCGGVKRGLTPEENAQKELREETGYLAKELTKVAEFTPFTGAADEISHVFVARDLEHAPLKMDATEDIEILICSRKEIEEFIRTNQMWDGLSLAAWSLTNHLFE